MKQIYIDKDNSSSTFLYEQLYIELKRQILCSDLCTNEKLPSIRHLSEELSVSVTTVMQAYNQLLSEGYIKNKPGSGYFVKKISDYASENSSVPKTLDYEQDILSSTEAEYIYDEEAFDFIKWKKCSSKIYTEYSNSLMFESELKGEYALRAEISKYLFKSRGVSVSADDIIIAAGTQQSIFHLGRLLKYIGINLISLEKPGYNPVKSMFLDAHFTTSDIPVTKNGINTEMLPVNIKSAVYVNPSNQFPTGVVMPAAVRYEILEWAKANDSFIIEDDYNSELRYFGKPLPTIKSLDLYDRVIYLGSFSSTLFPAIKISYMVLPKELTKVFEATKSGYSQTCSKAEQLTLAYYMSLGYYYTTIRKKRALFAKKLKSVTEAFEKYKYDEIEFNNTNSGLFVMFKIKTDKDISIFIDIAKKLKLRVTGINELSDDREICVSLYYSLIPLGSIDFILNILMYKWKTVI